MLDYDHFKRDQVQETASEYAPVRLGRSLTRPSAVYADIILNEPAHASKRRCSLLPFFHSDAGFYTLEDDCEHALRQITRRKSLPGIEHLSSVENRSAFIAYGNEYSFVGDKVSATMLPGENFFLADNHTDVGLSAQYSTTESLLTHIDELVDDETIIEDFTDSTSFQQEQSTNNVHLSAGSSFGILNSRVVGYTALD
jgi:hypothetical protein